MHRSVGLAAAERKRHIALQYQQTGSALSNSHIQQLSTQLSTFHAALTLFARNHARQIKANPAFRSAFVDMCTAINVDPLASTSISSRSLWSQFHVSDFYRELAVCIVETCYQSRGQNGGLIKLDSLAAIISERHLKTGGDQVSEDDILRAVKTLKPLGSGFDVIEIGDCKLIRSVPKELNLDQTTALEAAQIMGFITLSMLTDNLHWDASRAAAVLEDLVSDAFVWVDEQAAEVEYWIPSTVL